MDQWVVSFTKMWRLALYCWGNCRLNFHTRYQRHRSQRLGRAHYCQQVVLQLGPQSAGCVVLNLHQRSSHWIYDSRVKRSGASTSTRSYHLVGLPVQHQHLCRPRPIIRDIPSCRHDCIGRRCVGLFHKHMRSWLEGIKYGLLSPFAHDGIDGFQEVGVLRRCRGCRAGAEVLFSIAPLYTVPGFHLKEKERKNNADCTLIRNRAACR